LASDSSIFRILSVVSLLFSCGTVDGAYGPVKNPWQYKFRRHVDELTLHSASSLPSSSSQIQRIGQHARDYHISTTSSVSTDRIHSVHGGARGVPDADTEDSDFFITGGSSGGSAVAVAIGVAFA